MAGQVMQALPAPAEWHALPRHLSSIAEVPSMKQSASTSISKRKQAPPPGAEAKAHGHT